MRHFSYKDAILFPFFSNKWNITREKITMVINRVYAVKHSIFRAFLPNKLNELILDMYRVWSFFAIWFSHSKGQNVTKPDTYSESARLACSNEFYGRNTLNIEFLTSYTLAIRALKMGVACCNETHLLNSSESFLVRFLISCLGICSHFAAGVPGRGKN